MPFVNEMLDSIADTNRARRETDASTSDGAVGEAPSSSLISRFKYDVGAVGRELRGNILGQDEAISAVENILKVVRADIADPQRPLYVALFLGPTGVGKTEIVRVLAKAIHGDREAFCRVDMNTLSQEHYSAALTGPPPGYVGSKEGFTLLDKETIEGSFSKPGIVLFDELEKASQPVLQALLNVFDNGVMTVASGQQQISFRNSMIFMTSNIGAREIQDYERKRAGAWWRRFVPTHAAAHDRAVDRIVEDKLNERLDPEFINRIDHIAVFNWIDRSVVEDLVDIELRHLNIRLRKHNCTLKLSADVRNFLSREGFDRRYGARALKRTIRKHLEVPMAELLLSEHRRAQEWNHYVACLTDGTISFEMAPD